MLHIAARYRLACTRMYVLVPDYINFSHDGQN
jgi:hypothetical protein